MSREDTTDFSQSTIEEERPRNFYVIRTLTFIFVAVLYALVVFQKQCPSIVVEDMAASFQTTVKELSTFSAIYFYFYAAIQPFAGLFVDIFDSVRVCAISGLIASCGSILCGFSKDIVFEYIGRCMVGIGCGPMYVSAVRIFSNWFLTSSLPTLLGILMAVSCVGGALATVPLMYFCQKFGWRTAFYTIGGTNGVVSLLLLTISRGSPEKKGFTPVNFRTVAPTQKQTFGQRLKTLCSNIMQVIVNPYFWVINGYNVTLQCPYYNFVGYWGGPYLTEVYDFSKMKKSIQFLGISVGLFIGSLLLPFIVRVAHTKKIVLIISSLGTMIPFTIMTFRGDSLYPFEFWVYFIIIGAFTMPLGAITYPLLTEYYSPAVSGSAVGFGNLFLNGFIAIYTQVSRIVVPHYGTTDNGYTWKGYQMGLFLFSAVSVVVSLFLAFIARDDSSNICRRKRNLATIEPLSASLLLD